MSTKLRTEYSDFFDHYIKIQQEHARKMSCLLLGAQDTLTITLEEVYTEIYEALFAQAQRNDRLFVIHAGDFSRWREGLFEAYLNAQAKAVIKKGLAIHRLVLLTKEDFDLGNDMITNHLFAMSKNNIAVTVTNAKAITGDTTSHLHYNIGVYSRAQHTQSDEALCLQYQCDMNRDQHRENIRHVKILFRSADSPNTDDEYCPITLFLSAFMHVGYDIEKLWNSPLETEPSSSSSSEVLYLPPKAHVGGKLAKITKGVNLMLNNMRVVEI